VLTAPTKATFAALSAARNARIDGMRGARFFHPDGVGFEAELLIAGNSSAPEGTLLGDPAGHMATVRFSRAVGLPSPVPEILGVAIRLPDVHGPGAHQDFMLVSSWRMVAGRHALVPATRGFFGTFFSSLVPYNVGGEIMLLGLDPGSDHPTPHDLEGLAATATGRSYTVCLAPFLGGWAAAGMLTIGDRLPDAPVEALRFNPLNTGGGIRPAGPLQAFRAAAYEGSQAGRLR
jgi:hypothetical protein